MQLHTLIFTYVINLDVVNLIDNDSESFLDAIFPNSGRIINGLGVVGVG